MEQTTSLAPYRTAAIVPKEPEPQETFGLIIAKKPHECNVPGWWKRLFYTLTFRSIRHLSLFRCKGCREVRKFNGRTIIGEWEHVNSDTWADLGGVVIETPEEIKKKERRRY